jgi:hypothetical protein
LSAVDSADFTRLTCRNAFPDFLSCSGRATSRQKRHVYFEEAGRHARPGRSTVPTTIAEWVNALISAAVQAEVRRQVADADRKPGTRQRWRLAPTRPG